MAMHENTIHFACISEHWLTDQAKNTLAINGYNIASIYCRNTKRHGGVLILVKSNIDFAERNDLKEMSVEVDIEIAATEIKSYNSLIISLYRSPKGDFDNFINILNKVLNVLEQESTYKSIFICGDFNVNFLENSLYTETLINLFTSFNLHKTVTEPSRICKTSSSCIDNIFTNVEKSNYYVKTLNMHISDHLSQVMVYKNLSNKKSENKREIKNVRIINNQNIEIFKWELRNTQWPQLLTNKPATEMCTLFHDQLMQSFDRSFPERKICVGDGGEDRGRCAIISENLKQMKNTLDVISIAAKVTKDSKTYDLYNNLKTEYKKAIDSEVRNNYMKRITCSDNRQKSIWEIIKKNTKTCPKSNEKLQLTSDELNTHFATVNTNVAVTANSAQDLLCTTKKLNEKTCYFQPVTHEEILQICRSMKSKSTVDHYGLSTKLLKQVIEFLVEPLVLLINTCILEGVYPREFKCAKVIPIHKKGDVNNPNNYRPISILPTVSKIFEHVISDRLTNFFVKYGIISKSQHGFCQNRSTITAIEDIMQTILEALDNNKHIQMTCFDLSKAFDSVSHRILLNKLFYYGIRGNVHDLLSSYLTNREQYVICHGQKSRKIEVKRGVPQGSVIGPLLFLVYVNDLEKNLSADKVCLYADDTTTLTSHIELGSMMHHAAKVTQEAQAWFSCNELSLNMSKTQSLKFNTTRDANVESLKLLGMHIDNKLNWKTHISELTKKLSVAIYSIRRIKGISTYEAARMTYFANFHSLASYGIQFWGTSAEADRVFILQKRAVRILSDLKQSDSCRNAFVKNKILTIPSVYILTVAKYVHRNKNSYHKGGDTHNYPTRCQNLLRTPFHRLSTTQKYVDYWGVKIYNKLPETMCAQKMIRFTKDLKKLLLQNAYYSLDEFLNCEL